MAANSDTLPRILVLGGVGHIGRTFIKFLLDKNLVSYVRVADKAIPVIAYCSEEHETCFKDPRVEFIQSDLTKPPHLDNVFDVEVGFDYIVNCAAETRNGLEEDMYKKRVQGLSVECAKRAIALSSKDGNNKVLKKYIELSTGQVYASQTRAPAKEDGLLKPWTLHAKYKLLAEEELRSMGNTLPLVVLRLATVYGRADVHGVMPRVVTAAAYKLLGEKMSFLWGSEMKINTVHVEDAVRAIWHACIQLPKQSVWNLCDQGDTTQGKMSKILGELFGIQTGFYGKLISNFARLNLSSVVDEANDKHMAPWNQLCKNENIRATPLDPYMDKELLSSNHLYLDGTAIVEKGGFVYNHECVTLEKIKDQVEYAISQKIFPNILEDGKVSAKK